ncbi:uncharacterized protein PGTG_00554 [Puccinia graminis f. sp. tritici CRL 75-36-700-3]|uniref:Uncharacterized protein n=1 Tax=Puccinia graminis f. sp. tritici (strain CRL 75-36-700-3 / race SCCL) TaxID=418459 RepID=E3JRD4_PUCGT|nr:uncharacterized protein PGTG_00554 [Puccinia graminis f. sp. tritici CRL 75-36-700-3]EFP74598.1 hypothetical protein PGTG_00554 [Puccinia graminis f. sp. tritici CRL 75-36-700-3]
MSTPASGAPGKLFDIELTVQSSVIPSVFESGPCEKFKPSADGHSQRSVLFFVPESVQGKQNVPLLIAFHGSTENGSIFRSRTTAMAYDKLAAEMGFIVAYPSGYKGNWNDSRKAAAYPAKMENIDDVGFTTSIIQYSAKNWSTCPQRTLIAGYSNGGHMCYRLALELGSRYIAGVAVHCANLPTEDNSDCATLLNDAVPICIVNGTADPVNPWGGGEVTLSHAPVPGGSVGSRGSHQSAVETADYFAARFLDLGVELELEEIEDMDEVQDVRQFRTPRTDKVYVKLLAMIGEGHYVPVASGEKKALVIGPRRGAVHAPREVLQFFAENTMCFEASYPESDE